MSLGNTYNNPSNTTGNNSKVFDPTVYSAYRMNNAESAIDPTCLTFRFWKNNLCIGIFPRKNTGTDEVQFDMDNGITIYLSHTKARILADEIKKYLQNPVAYNGAGVPSGQAAISISNGAEYGKNSDVLTIRKVNENGEVVSSFAYEFKHDYHFSIRGYIGESFDKIYEDYQKLEIEQVVTVLEEYYKAVTNAVAFTVMDQRKFGANRTDTKLDAIAAALGVETNRSSGGQRRFNNNSYFNGNNNGSSNNGASGSYSSGVAYGSASLDDIE